MKRVIYKPEQFEKISANAVSYTLPDNGFVVDAIVEDDFVTAGIVLYDSVNGPMLNEPFIHHFEGWEINPEVTQLVD